MYRPNMCWSGREAIDPSTLLLSAQRHREEHKATCDVCRGEDGLSPHCYFDRMSRCLSNGWAPMIDVHTVEPVYHVEDNYSSISDFYKSVDKEFQKMVLNGVVKPISGPQWP